MTSKKNLPKSGYWGLIGLVIVVLLFSISTVVYGRLELGSEIYTATFFMLFNIIVSII
ncbi:MAG: hypothetical protein GY863_20740 [bacterium]|nr:hypothetical protein [bacterium]